MMKKLLFLFLFIACQQAPNSKVLRTTLATEPPTLDWNLATDGISYQVISQLAEGLTQFDLQMNLKPAAAASWEVKDEGLTYEFHLDPAYTWSDGVPLTSAHFKDSWLRLLNPKTAAEYAYFLFDIKNAKDFSLGKITNPAEVGIETPDPQTLIVRLEKPVAFFPAITSFMVTYPIRLDLIEKYGSRWTTPPNLVSVGPFILKEWKHDAKLVLAPNPHYGGFPKPKLRQIDIQLVSDPMTALSLYETGSLDAAPLPPMAMPTYKNSADHVTQSKLRGYYLGFNTAKIDKNVRQALALGLDRQSLKQVLLSGEIPVKSWIPPGMPAFNSEIGLPFDTTRAKEILNNAGPLNMTLMFNSDALNKKIAEWAQEQWNKNLGLKVEINNQEWKTYLHEVKASPTEIFRMGWGADYPDPDNFMNLFTSWSGNNHTRWKNAEYDSLIARAASEQDTDIRMKLYDEAQKMILEDETILIPLFVSVQNLLVKKEFRPYPVIPLDIVLWKYL